MNGMNLNKTDTVPVAGWMVATVLDWLGKVTLSQAVMAATLIFTLCKIPPAAIHAYKVIRRIFKKGQNE
jgi:hypothetical protein